MRIIFNKNLKNFHTGEYNVIYSKRRLKIIASMV